MSYFEWFLSHADKHRAVIEKLEAKKFTKEAVIAYFEFDNMVIHEPDFCLLYAQKQKCHNMAHLNCFLCACPFFRFNDDGLGHHDGKSVRSECSIHAKNARWFVHENVMHQDCSLCLLPHTKGFVFKHFDRYWKRIMSACLVTSPKV